MKIAFHFDAESPEFKGPHGRAIDREFLRIFTWYHRKDWDSKIFSGDFLLLQHLDNLRKPELTEGEVIANCDRFCQEWFLPKNGAWRSLPVSKFEVLTKKNVYILCAESIDEDIANFLHQKLEKYPWYIGAMEVDDTSPIHWAVYTNSLEAKFRVFRGSLFLLYDGTDEGEHGKPVGLKKSCADLGFQKVDFFDLQGKFTIFDSNLGFERSRRAAEWKRDVSLELGGIVDRIIAQLSDTAPELNDKLFALMKTFRSAETREEYAQVMATCRRVFEYVVDRVFPPRNEEIDGHNLGVDRHRNRFLAFIKDQGCGETLADLISSDIGLWSKQIENFSHLVNKGVHSEIAREEARRGLLRMMLLLDDIVTLKQVPFLASDHNDPEILNALFSDPQNGDSQ